jgi:response regulator RpfG family c-di-GMP phosphodiesterase
MFDPVAQSSTQQIVVAKADAKYSRSTIANLNDAAEKLTQTKKSMLDDMSRGAFQTPQDALDAIMQLQRIQNDVDALKDSISKKATEGFGAKDVETIEEMKRQGKSEEKIAELFDTNQTKINRLRNGKATLDVA